MQKLWLVNVSPDATDDDLKELVRKYAPELQCSEIRREPGDGTRPAAALTVTGPRLESVGALAQRLNGMYWKGRTLGASTMIG